MPDEKPKPQPLEYSTPAKPDSSATVRLVLFILGVTAFGAFIILMINMRMHGGPTGYNNRDKCASNLHQIGLGILLYCNDNNGVYPDSFQTLLINEQLTAQVFVCPSTNDNPSTAPTT